MEFLIIMAVAVIIVALAFVGLAFRILFKKGGKFPNSHISGNKALTTQGISCAQSFDKEEQRKAWQ